MKSNKGMWVSKTAIILIVFVVAIIVSGSIIYTFILRPPTPTPTPTPTSTASPSIPPSPLKISSTTSSDGEVKVVVKNNGGEGFFTIYAEFSYWGGKIQDQKSISMMSGATQEVIFKFNTNPFVATPTPTPTPNPTLVEPTPSPSPLPSGTPMPPSSRVWFTVP